MVPRRKVSGTLVAVSCAFLMGAGSASAVPIIEFDPATPTFIVDEGGFTGTLTPTNPYVDASVRFTSSGLSPLPKNFSITNIRLKGDGITESLDLGSVTFTGNQGRNTEEISLSLPVSSLDFGNSLISFNLPGGGEINQGASFSVTVRYQDAGGANINSSTAVNFTAVPEPSTMVLAGVAVPMLLWLSRRRRSRDAIRVHDVGCWSPEA